MGILLFNGPKKSCRATKLIASLHDSDYGTRLKELRLPSLEYRRQRGDVIFLYKIFNNLVDIDTNDLFMLSLGIIRGHGLKFFKCHSSYLLRSQCIVNTWNNTDSIPSSLIETCSLNDFKTKLDIY